MASSSIVFVYYFVHVDKSFREINLDLLNRFDEMSSLAESAYRHGEGIRFKMSGEAEPEPATGVSLDIYEPISAHAHTTIPIVWAIDGPSHVFPGMSGDLIVSPLGKSRVQITYRGSYDPQQEPDRVGPPPNSLHRVAEATIKTFLDSLAVALSSSTKPALGSTR